MSKKLHMTKITVASKSDIARVTEIMEREVLHNPNLNGVDFTVTFDDYDGVEGIDAVTDTQLFYTLFSSEQE